MAKHITDTAYIEILEEFRFTDRKVLEEKETEWIHRFSGENLINERKLMREETVKEEVKPVFKKMKAVKPFFDKSKNAWVVEAKGVKKRFKKQEDAVAFAETV